MSINYKSSHPRWLPYSIMGLLILLVFQGCTIFSKLGQKAEVEKVGYIQNAVTGKVDLAESVDKFKVSPSNVIRFIKQWKVSTFTWTGKNPDGTPDPGSTLADTKVPTPLLKGMTFVENPFQSQYVLAFAKAYNASYPISAFTSVGKFTSEVEQKSLRVTQVKEVNPGKWLVYLVSKRTITSTQDKKALYDIKAEEITLEVTLPHVQTWEPKESPYSTVFQELENQRLLITNIKELSLER
jgi:hypothetical protein